MSIVSYAQNFEDVMLWRALSHIEHGFYIDIGAQDPIIDSVSLAFHEHGWRGIHVEPTPHYAELLRQQRPGDTVIQVAVGSGSAVIKFFEIPDTGISTADPVIAQQHRERGFNVLEIIVPSISLSDIFESCIEPEIHWLKIDVEGFEQQALFSWGKSMVRPWIVVVESTLPLTQIETHESWESILIGYGYTPAYFDGLNRYYISEAHPELGDAFLSPPNVFDGFTLNGTASAPFHHLIVARCQEKISGILAKYEQQRQLASNEIECLTLSLGSLDKAHADEASVLRFQYDEQINSARQALEAHLRTQVLREQEIAAQLLMMQQQVHQDKAELVRSHNEQEHTLRSEHTERELILIQQLRAGQQELEIFLRTQAQREQEVSSQLLAMQQLANQEKIELVRNQNEQECVLQRQLGEQLRAEREAVQQLQQLSNTLQHELVAMRNDLLWRFTAPLRAVAGWFKSASTQTVYATSGAEQPVAAPMLRPVPHAATHGTKESASSHLHGEIMSKTTEHSTHTTQAPQTSGAAKLKALLQLEESQFIKIAYQVLLKRPPDSAGFKYYIKRIHSGVPKVKILDQIMSSQEARKLSVEIPGLHKAIRQQKMISLPLIGKALQFFIGGDTSDEVMPLNELLIRNNKEFVEYAYLTLLKRAPDLEGFNYYLGRLKAGVPKIQILMQLLDSREARVISVELPGLRGAVMRQKIARLPLVGVIFKIFVEVEGNSALETRLRAVEQQIFLLGQQSDLHLAQIERYFVNTTNLPIRHVVPEAFSRTQSILSQTIVFTETPATNVIEQLAELLVGSKEAQQLSLRQ